MSDTLHLNPSRALDITGFAVPGALAYFYNSGTSTLRRVYADAAGATPLPQPVQANGAGLFPMIFDLAAGDAKVVVTTPEGAMLPGYPLDPVPRSSVGDAGARGIVFAPTDDMLRFPRRTDHGALYPHGALLPVRLAGRAGLAGVGRGEQDGAHQCR